MPEQDPRLIPPDIQPPSQFLDDEGRPSLLPYAVRTPVEQLYEWELDWDRYFEEFSLKHGGMPIQVGEWLVWEDGWSLYAYHPGGTEQPPPEDEEKLHALMLAYWTARGAIMHEELLRVRSRVESLESIQRVKSLPLCVRSVEWTEREGQDGFSVYSPRIVRGGIDLSQQYRAMEDLRKDVELCEREVMVVRQRSLSFEIGGRLRNGRAPIEKENGDESDG